MEENKRTYTIRLSDNIARRVEETAQGAEVTPTTLLQMVLTERFGDGGNASAAHDSRVVNAPATNANGAGPLLDRYFRQLVFEVGKTRSAVLRIGLQTIAEETMREILASAESDAKSYSARLIVEMNGAAGNGDGGDARAE